MRYFNESTARAFRWSIETCNRLQRIFDRPQWTGRSGRPAPRWRGLRDLRSGGSNSASFGSRRSTVTPDDAKIELALELVPHSLRSWSYGSKSKQSAGGRSRVLVWPGRPGHGGGRTGSGSSPLGTARRWSWRGGSAWSTARRCTPRSTPRMRRRCGCSVRCRSSGIGPSTCGRCRRARGCRRRRWRSSRCPPPKLSGMTGSGNSMTCCGRIRRGCGAGSGRRRTGRPSTIRTMTRRCIRLHWNRRPASSPAWHGYG